VVELVGEGRELEVPVVPAQVAVLHVHAGRNWSLHLNHLLHIIYVYPNSLLYLHQPYVTFGLV
jgi:hypothetical protein